jgi:hypothetical protein
MSARRPTTPTLQEISQRLDELAAKVERQQSAFAVSPWWWEEHAGRFENDPAFDEIMRIVRRQRKLESLPKQRGKRGAKRARA